MSRTIGEMAASLEALSSNATMTAIRREVAVGGVKLIAQGFKTSTDPYGAKWPGLKTARPGGPVEVKTGAMRDSTMARPTTTGVRFSVNTDYAAYQHYGTKTNPQRRLMPVKYLGIPAAWREMIARAYTRTTRSVLSLGLR